MVGEPGAQRQKVRSKRLPLDVLSIQDGEG